MRTGLGKHRRLTPAQVYHPRWKLFVLRTIFRPRIVRPIPLSRHHHLPGKGQHRSADNHWRCRLNGDRIRLCGRRAWGPIVGKVYHLTEDGTITEMAGDLHYANGVVLGADGKRLYVNESEAGRVISFAVADDGSLSDRRLFVRLSVVDEVSGIGAYPDGIKLGPDGNFYIGQYSKGRIIVVDKDGKFVRAIDVPSATAHHRARTAKLFPLLPVVASGRKNHHPWHKHLRRIANQRSSFADEECCSCAPWFTPQRAAAACSVRALAAVGQR